MGQKRSFIITATLGALLISPCLHAENYYLCTPEPASHQVWYQINADSERIYKFDGCENGKLTIWTCEGSTPVSNVTDCVAIGKQCSVSTYECMGMQPGDTDQDGKIDKNDNCPSIANPDQLDIDGDGYGDACDNCSYTYNTDQADANSDGLGDACPPTDCLDLEGNPYAVNSNSLDSCIDQNFVKEVICDNTYLQIQKIELVLLCPAGCANNKCNQSTTGNPDQDQDSVPDNLDNCPMKFNSNQKDHDNDDVGDVCDNCPDDKNSDQKDSDNDGVGDECYVPNDVDNDGVPNEYDNCPETPNSNQTDSDENGIGDACEPEVEDCGHAYCSPSDKGNCHLTDSETIELNSLSTIDYYATANSGSQFWIAGEGGNILKKYGNLNWEKMRSPWEDFKIDGLSSKQRAITALWAPNTNELYATSAAGYVFRFRNNQWTIRANSGGKALYSISGNTKEMWAVGESNTILRYTFSTDKWERLEPWYFGMRYFEQKKQYLLVPIKYTNINAWRAVHALEDKVMLVGDNGIVFQFKNKLWRKIDLGTTVDMRAVWTNDSFTVMAGGNKIWCKDGNAASKICYQAPNLLTKILNISGSDINNLYAVGTKNLIVKKTGNTWSPLEVKTLFSNSLTSSSTSGARIIISGINGVILELNGAALSTKFTMTSELYNKNWTDTVWTSHQGGLDDFYVAGDDLSIGYRNTDGLWGLIYSDDNVVPFEKDAPTKRTIRDLYVYGTPNDINILGVGNFGFAIKVSLNIDDITTTKFNNIPLSGSGVANMRSVRKGFKSGESIVAGNLGVFEIGNDDSVRKITNGEILGGAVADIRLDKELWIAAPEGCYINTNGEWKYLMFDSPISPVDIKMTDEIVVVIGDKKKQSTGVTSWPFNKPTIKKFDLGHADQSANAYFLVSLVDWSKPSTFWWENVAVPKNNMKLLGLQTFKEKIDIPFKDDKILRGMLATGTNGYISVWSDNAWESGNTENTEDWYDGTYDFHYGASYVHQTGWSTVDITGVGGHNSYITLYSRIECSY